MPVRGFTATEELRAPNVPGGEVGPRAHPLVLMFDFRDAIRSGRHWRMSAAARLHAGLFVGRQDAVVRRQPFPLPDAGVQVEDGTGFRGKVGIAREEPTAMAPRPDRIGGEPAPHGRAADGRDDAARDDLALQLAQRPARQRDAGGARTLAREALDLNDDAGGKSGLCARLVALRPSRRGVGRRTASAIC